MNRPISALLGLWAICPLLLQAAPTDTISAPSIIDFTVYSEQQWASTAANKFILAGLAFGGDISGPVNQMTLLTSKQRIAMGGGSSRMGIALTLPSPDILPLPERGRWHTTVALEQQQMANAEWSFGAARLMFGPHGSAEQESGGFLGGTQFSGVSATSLKVGGVRTHRSSVGNLPVDVTMQWSVNVGEMHQYRSFYVRARSEYTWDDEALAMDLDAQQIKPIGVGTLLGLDLGLSIEEADGGAGRKDRWSVAIRDWGSAKFREGVYQRVDTAFFTQGWPLITEGTPDFSDVMQSDTLMGSFKRRMPSTLCFSWEREALRNPGVTWALNAQSVAWAPRGQVEVVRRSGRGAVQTAVGLGYGGWGGTFIPLNFTLPSVAVRQGQPGGALVVSTHWLAVPRQGGRMALGLRWHQSF